MKPQASSCPTGTLVGKRGWFCHVIAGYVAHAQMAVLSQVTDHSGNTVRSRPDRGEWQVPRAPLACSNCPNGSAIGRSRGRRGLGTRP